MFEQSLYEPEMIAEPTVEGDLFHNYEIRNWDLGPRIYKILGMAGAANLLAILIVAQTSLLTMKGCDSPLVGRVCQVLDTVYVGSMMFGTDREYVDAVYEKTELSDADVTFVDVTGVTPPLSYPEGYFQIANPEQFQASIDALNNPGFLPDINDLAGIPVTPPSTGGGLIDTKPNLPPSNPTVVDGGLPTFNNGGIASNPSPRNTRRTNRNKLPGNKAVVPDEDDTATVSNTNTNTNTQKPVEPKKVDPLPPESGVVINREPLKDFGKGVAEKVDKKEVDLAVNFNVIADGVVTKEGKLDTSIDKKSKQPKTRIVLAEGDPKIVAVVKDAISAISDSGWLKYLSNQGIEKISLKFSQSDDSLLVTIVSQQITPERAKTISSGLGGAISGALVLDRMGTVKLGDDEKTLLTAAKVTPNDKLVVLDFVLPKPVAQEMIQRNVQRAREAETGKKSQSVEISPSSRTTGKN